MILPSFFPLVVSIEDPFDQDDWPAWSQFTASVGIQVRYCTLSLSCGTKLALVLKGVLQELHLIHENGFSR